MIDIGNTAHNRGGEVTPEHQKAMDRIRIEELEALLAQLETRLDALQAAGAAGEGISPLLDRLHELQRQLDVSQRELSQRDHSVTELERRCYEYEAVAARAEAESAALRASLSWRLTAPLRAGLDALKLARRPLPPATAIGSVPAWLWQHAPLSGERKRRTESRLFKRLPSLERMVSRYSRWRLGAGQGSVSSTPSPLARWQLPQPGSHAPAKDPGAAADPGPVSRIPPDHRTTLVAFYLPQFHAIPENDRWWGEGFTEWTNVAPAKPQFEGHYQPHVPGQLGYYDLLDGETQAKQVELAKDFGVGAFCFYFYWFGGKRLLEEPIQRYLADPALDLPFCLCWANENWSRRWDGLDQEILIAQDHSPEDDIAFIAHVAAYLRDPRYLRVRGRPLLLVYRPALLPDPCKTAERWRNWCRENGVGEIFLAYTQSFEVTDPSTYSFDAAVEFPPNNTAPPLITSQVVPGNSPFKGLVYDWSVFPRRSESYSNPGYTIFRAVCPGWDNTARRKSNSTIFLGNTPQGYERWLGNAVRDTCRRMDEPSERLVFVNAWNEWAEGAHLEPDERDGLAYLEATRRVLGPISGENSEAGAASLLLVTHDCHPHGAQYLALNIARHISARLRIPLHILALSGGSLEEEFAKCGSFKVLEEGSSSNEQLLLLEARSFHGLGIRHVLLNTVVCGHLATAFAALGASVTCLIHELPGIIRSMGLQSQAQAIARCATTVIFGAEAVKAGFGQLADHPPSRQLVRGQGLFVRSPYRGRMGEPQPRSALRSKLGFDEETPIVLAVGYGDHRKGLDLFIETAALMLTLGSPARFVWVGHFDHALHSRTLLRIKESGRPVPEVRMVGMEFDTTDYYAGSDVYLLASREDPFPSVVLEALSVGLPVVAIADSGGGADLVGSGCGILAGAPDPTLLADAVSGLIDDPGLRRRLGSEGMARVARDYSFDRYVADLMHTCGLRRPRVSVVVPNYNYSHLLRDRIDSIAAQTLAPYEVIVLDDASSDDSVAVLEALRSEIDIDLQVVASESNSGSVFRQWQRGVSLARGDLVWIAEADDLADPRFLETVATSVFEDSSLVMAYAQSRQIDGEGRPLAADYRYYTDLAEPGRWDTDYQRSGEAEVRGALAVLNCIPNVSAAVFRRGPLLETLDSCIDEISRTRVAGDWHVYLRLLVRGKIRFHHQPLNVHRRHGTSVTHCHQALPHLSEIVGAQELAAKLFRLEPDVIANQRRYALKVARDLGIAGPDQVRGAAEFPQLARLFQGSEAA